MKKKRKFVLQIFLGLLLTELSASAQAYEETAESPEQHVYDLCARGVNNELEQPFLQTLHVIVTYSGPISELDEFGRNLLSEELIRNTIWKGQASEVYVEKFDASGCSASGNNITEIAVNVSQEDIKRIQDAVILGGIRGFPEEIERVTEIAKRAWLRFDHPDSPSETQKLWLRVFYVTNREATKVDSTTHAFNMKRVDELSYGSVEVSVLHQKEMKNIESPAIFKFEKATSLNNFAVTEKIVPLSKSEWLQELKLRASKFAKPGVLLFIHGYNVTFADAARRTGQLTYDLAFPGPTIFFSWPSDESVIRYPRDGRDAENSWAAAESVLSDLTGLLPDGRGPVYVVAHSMGNRVLIGGLARLLEKAPSKRKALKEIVMAAPDVDQESFALNWAQKLLNTGPRFTLYASQHDLALGSSEFLHGGKRLGVGGKSLFVMQGLDSVDASAVTKEFFALNHSYFGDTSAVLSDIFFLIRQGIPPKGRPHLKPLSNLDTGPWEIPLNRAGQLQ